MTDERAAHRPRGERRHRPLTARLAPLVGDRKGDQLHEILQDLLASLEPGEKLPSERELAQRYGVARMTVRGVIGRLAQQGLVHRVQGQGTFVSEPRLAQPASLTSFTEDMIARGLTPGSIILAQEVVTAPRPVAVRLELGANERIVRIERVRSGDGDPIALERAHLPARRFPGLEDVDLVEHSLYGTLSAEYGCELGTSRQRIAAVTLSHAEAHLLHAEEGTPALQIERVACDLEGTPVEFVRSVYRGDRFELHTEQQRSGGPRPADGSS